MSQLQKKSIGLLLFLLVAISTSTIVYRLLGSKEDVVKISSAMVEEKAVIKDRAVEVAVPATAEKQDVPAVINNEVPEVPVINDVEALKAVSQYPVHRNIATTYFWAGEEAGKDNKNISNLPSAWDEQWVKHFGGVDSPNKRAGFAPANFTPKENPFYFALPFNDFDNNGKQKKDIYALATWASGKKVSGNISVCKNQWIKIMKGGKVAYAQWEDVGPFGEDDSAYVFGNAAPKSKTNEQAGLDVSPAVRDYLGLSDIDKTDWQFVDNAQVPDGPWKKVVTTSQVYWE